MFIMFYYDCIMIVLLLLLLLLCVETLWLLLSLLPLVTLFVCHGPDGRLCTLIGVPCRLSMLSTFSTFAIVLFSDKSPRAEGAKTDPPPGHTYEGTQTTA